MNAAWQDQDGFHFEPEVNYHRAWQAFARRYHTALFLLYGWPVISLGLFALSRLWMHQPVASLTIIVLWLGLAVAAIWRAGEFRCPRCHRRYAALGHKKGSSNMTRGLFDEVCSNCKLRKFEHAESVPIHSTRPVRRRRSSMIEPPDVGPAVSGPVPANEPEDVEPAVQPASRSEPQPAPQDNPQPEPLASEPEPLETRPKARLAEAEPARAEAEFAPTQPEPLELTPEPLTASAEPLGVKLSRPVNRKPRKSRKASK